jgi:hypothetical protein
LIKVNELSRNDLLLREKLMSGNYYIYCILKEYMIKNETLEKRKIDFYIHGKKV